MTWARLDLVTEKEKLDGGPVTQIPPKLSSSGGIRPCTHLLRFIADRIRHKSMAIHAKCASSLPLSKPSNTMESVLYGCRLHMPSM